MGLNRSHYCISGLVLGLAATACARSAEDQDAAPAQETQLEVVNRSSSDMDIYVVRGGQRIRIGLAPANETSRFTLLRAQVAGVGPARFVASPLGGFAETIGSEPVILRAGDVVTLNIPPP